jgi:hypothetical protein
VDGKLLVSGGRDKAVLIWSVAEGKLLPAMRGHGALVHDQSTIEFPLLALTLKAVAYFFG